MIPMHPSRLSLALATALLLAGAAQADYLPLEKMVLPPGFSIGVYAEGLTNARSMTRSPKGTVFVGSRDAGNVYAVVDEDGDYRAEKQYIVAQGLNMPNGVAFRDGALYVAELSRILRYDDIDAHLAAPPVPVVVYDGLPEEKLHGWKYLEFGPDGKLYFQIGSPVNIGEPEDERFATIARMNADGTEFEIYARGVRNSVGFAWHPETKELWFTDNGRDMLGDNRPPCELNCAPEKGMHFGFPYWHGADIPDPEFGEGHNASEFTAPAQELGPHVAPLGLTFYTGQMFPPEYRNQILIAEHGSWNRPTPIGYRITLVRIENNKPVSYEPFVEGWLQDTKAWGRPVDLLVLPDGSLLISDDAANAIYRLTYAAP